MTLRLVQVGVGGCGRDPARLPGAPGMGEVLADVAVLPDLTAVRCG